VQARLVCFALVFFLLIPAPAPAAGRNDVPRDVDKFLASLEGKCGKLGWTDLGLRGIQWERHRVTRGRNPLVFCRFGGAKGDCVLFLGGVHGDELPSVYLLLRLAGYLRDNPALFRDKCIVIAPLVNPDGFLCRTPTRVNANGIDINRNFPTRDWHADALRKWKSKGNGNRRYYPGRKPGSEQETLFQIALIKRFKPAKILSVHSPLGFYDFDGPTSDLDSFEKWLDGISRETDHPLKKFGYFPGSLGNYAGHERNVFTLTLELPSSDPVKGAEFFRKFQPAFLKFLDLKISGR
jgi:protein MpaA